MGRRRYAPIMAEETADDVARKLLATSSGRELHTVAVPALLACNEAFRTNDELIAEELRTNPAFRDEWGRTAPGRAVATALVRYRSDHDLSQRELADRLAMAESDVACLELGEGNSQHAGATSFVRSARDRAGYRRRASWNRVATRWD